MSDELIMHDALLASPNKYVKMRAKSGKKWMRKDGTVVYIKDMSTTHIRNSIRMMDRAGQTKLKAYRGLVRELCRRVDEMIDNAV
jgi:hypothetical protein